MRISPDNKEHAQLEDDVTNYLEQRGFCVADAPYHNTMRTKVVKTLQYTTTPTSLYIRTRADRIAIRDNPPLVFQWEAKTHQSKEKHDCVIELTPILFHLALVDYDVRCLYVYRDLYKGYDAGFWMHNFPKVRSIMIPDCWNQYWTKWFKDLCVATLPETEVVSGIVSRGTGDPFLIIDESIIRKLSSWKNLIKEVIAGAL